MPRTRSLAWSELKIGILALLALAIAASVIFMVGNQGGFFWQVYRLRTSFADVQGLKEGALVRVSGIEVGSVKQIRFADQGADVEVEMELSKDMQSRVTTASRAGIGALSLLGETLIDINASSTGDPIPDGGYVQSRRPPAQIQDVAENATAVLGQATSVLADVKAGRGTVGKLFTDDALYGDIRTLLASATDVSRQFTRGNGTIGRLLRDPAVHESLDASLRNLDAILARISAGEGSLGRLMQDEAFAKSLTSATANFDALAARLNKGEGTAGKLLTDQALYTRLNDLTARLGEVAGRLEKGEGTLGQLLRDEQLYENMNVTITEFRTLVGEIRKDPRRYLNVRVSIF